MKCVNLGLVALLFSILMISSVYSCTTQSDCPGGVCYSGTCFGGSGTTGGTTTTPTGIGGGTVETCTPRCSGKECGTDGCGGSCGTCSSGETCVSGICISTTPTGTGETQTTSCNPPCGTGYFCNHGDCYSISTGEVEGPTAPLPEGGTEGGAEGSTTENTLPLYPDINNEYGSVEATDASRESSVPAGTEQSLIDQALEMHQEAVMETYEDIPELAYYLNYDPTVQRFADGILDETGVYSANTQVYTSIPIDSDTGELGEPIIERYIIFEDQEASWWGPREIVTEDGDVYRKTTLTHLDDPDIPFGVSIVAYEYIPPEEVDGFSESESCTCSSWTSRGCGASSCSSDRNWQTRTCNPGGCSLESRCVFDESCASVPGGCPEGTNLLMRVCQDYTQQEWDSITTAQGIREENRIGNTYYACFPDNTDTFCCPDDYCVYNGVCFEPGTKRDLDGDGFEEVCAGDEGGSGLWDLEIGGTVN